MKRIITNITKKTNKQKKPLTNKTTTKKKKKERKKERNKSILLLSLVIVTLACSLFPDFCCHIETLAASLFRTHNTARHIILASEKHPTRH